MPRGLTCNYRLRASIVGQSPFRNTGELKKNNHAGVEFKDNK